KPPLLIDLTPQVPAQLQDRPGRGQPDAALPSFNSSRSTSLASVMLASKRPVASLARSARRSSIRRRSFGPRSRRRAVDSDIPDREAASLTVRPAATERANTSADPFTSWPLVISGHYWSGRG